MAKNFLLNSKIIIINFLVAILLSANSFAQENESSKSYETNLQKNNDAIEIRMVPKKRKLPEKTQIQIPKTPEIKESSEQDVNEDEHTVYKKYVDELEKVKTELDKQNITPKNLDANSDQVENPANNQERLKKLNDWREEQKKLREERLKKRDEESRNRYKINKERSVIKEIEELNKKNQEALQPKNKTNSLNNLPSQLPSSETQLPSSGSTIPSGSTSPSSSGKSINPTVPNSPTAVNIPAPSR
ncbi:MAG: hypothetical protein ACKOXJ_00570 [Alphaproteobacteria bacterium]